MTANKQMEMTVYIDVHRGVELFHFQLEYCACLCVVVCACLLTIDNGITLTMSTAMTTEFTSKAR